MPKINNKKFYVNAIKKFGTTAQGVNWLSKRNQELRFKEIAALLPDKLSLYTLGDAGCGFGDFYLYLAENIPKLYTGIDSVSEMVTLASKKTSQKIIHSNICNDSLPVHDYYICSGALNILTPFETHLFIQNCYNSVREAFIFNALHGDKESQTYNYLSKEFIESIAKKLDVKKVIYKEGYLENDITVMFLKK